MATTQSNQQLQDDPLAELQRARAERDAAASGDPLAALRASRRKRDEDALERQMLITIDPEVAASEAQTRAFERSGVIREREREAALRPPEPEPEPGPKEATLLDVTEALFRSSKFGRAGFLSDFKPGESRIGLPRQETPAVEEPEPEPLLKGVEGGEDAVEIDLGPEVVDGRVVRPMGDVQPVDPSGVGRPGAVPNLFNQEGFFSRDRRGPLDPESVALRPGVTPPDLEAFNRQLGLQPARIPHIRPRPTIAEIFNAVGDEIKKGTAAEARDPREIAETVVFAQPDVNVGQPLPERRIPVEPPLLEEQAKLPLTRHERLGAKVQEARLATQARFERIPLPLRVGLSASRGFLDGITAGRFDSHVSDWIFKATNAVRGVFGVEPATITVAELFSVLDRTMWEKVGGGVGFLAAAGAGIRLTGIGVAGTAKLAARGSRTRTFLQSFNPAVPTARGTRMLQAAVEGIPFDLAFQAEDSQERATNLVIGIVASALIGATPIAGAIRKAGDLDPAFRDPTTARGATRAGPEAFPITRTRPEGREGPLTIGEALRGETSRLDAEESAAREAADAGATADVPAPVSASGRRPKVLNTENQARYDAVEGAPRGAELLPTMQRVMDNDPAFIAAARRPQPGDLRDTTNLHSVPHATNPKLRIFFPRRVETVHNPAIKTLEEGGGWASQAERERAGALFEGQVRRDRIIYMVTGPPAAGKSTLANQLLRQIRGFLVDSDEVKKLLPEHDGGKAAGTVHRESSIIAHGRMLEAAVRRGDNIVLPMVGKSKEHVIDAAQKLINQGYEVHIVLNEIPPQEAVRRSYLRFLRSDKYIPPAYILDEVGNQPTSMYREAVESGIFTSHQRFTNDVPRGQKARLLESGGEIPDGQLLGAAADEAAAAARQSGSDPGPGRLGRGRDAGDAGDARQAGRGAAGEGVAPARAAQGDLFNPEVEVRHAPGPEGSSRAPEVTPRQVTDPMPPKAPEGVQANGRGGFFNLGRITKEGRLGPSAGAVRVDIGAALERVGEVTEATRSFLRREFTAPGDLPIRAWRLLLKAEGWFGAQMGDMKFTIRRFDDALRDAYGTRNLNTSQARRLNAAMSGQIPLSRIPEGMRAVVKQMRERVDGYSRQMIQSGMVEGELAAVIADNLGVYLSRSYKVFDTPSWQLENIPERIVNRARSWLREERPDLTDDEIQGLMKSILNKQNTSPLQFLTSGTLGSKDLSMLIKRKDIAPPIRALMGEHTDVRLRYARSVNNMARALSNHAFLTEVKNTLRAGPDNPNGLFYKVATENANGSFIQPIAAEGSKVMEPLNGLFTTPEIAAAFQRQFDAPGAQNWLWSAYLKANALVKFDKTVLSMMTHTRNLIGNAGFAMANGHWNVSHFGRAIQAVNASAGFTRTGRLGTRFALGKVGVEITARPQGRGARTAQLERRLRIREQRLEGESPWEAYYRKLQLLGVVDSSAHAGELQAVIKDAADLGLDNYDPDAGNLAKAARGFIETATTLYRAEDDLWKVVAFENEFARYRKAMPDATEAEVEETAAWIVRNTYPNYGMISTGVQALRKNILLGSFVSFPAEVFRTGWHTINLAVKELRSPNAEIRKIGATRMTGITLAAGGLYAASAASRWVNGIDARTDKDLRPFLAPWQENSSLIYTHSPENGVYSLIDLSYTDPYSYLRDPLRRLFSGDGDWEEALLEATLQAASPFIGEEILFGKLSDINRNQKAQGGQVFNPEDHPVDRAFSILDHLWSAIEPGTIASARRIAKGIKKETNVFGQEFDAMTEFLAVVTGHRLQKTDVRQALTFRTSELDRRLGNANRILNRVVNRAGTVTDGEITRAFRDSEASRAKVFEDAHEIALKAINSHGLTNQEVIKAFRDAGMSRVNAAAVVNSGIPPRRNPQVDDVNRAALIRSLNR